MKFRQIVLDSAIILASESEHPQAQLAAIILDRRGKIVSVGLNTTKTHPRQRYFAEVVGRDCCCQLHAEMSALVKCKFDIACYDIYIARVLKSGKSAMAKPCPICMEAIKMTNIKNIVYTTDDEFCVGIEQN